jgi:hypothetical protein
MSFHLSMYSVLVNFPIGLALPLPSSSMAPRLTVSLLFLELRAIDISLSLFPISILNLLHFMLYYDHDLASA